MRNLIRAEFRKLRRCSIILVGLVILVFSPLLSLLQQISMNQPALDYGFENLVNATIWYNMSLFMPVTLMLLGGYIINREYTDDTMKNLLTIPLSYRKLMCGKLMTLAILTVLYSTYSFIIALLASIIYFPKGLTFPTIVIGWGQVVGMGLCIYLAILPIVGWCGGKEKRFLAGSVIAFLYGFLSIPISGQGIGDFYPMTAGLSLIYYKGDTGSAKASNNTGAAIVILIMMLILTYIILRWQAQRHD